MSPIGHRMDHVLARNLPLLPGYTFNFNVGADRFHRPHHWLLQNGVPVLADRDCPKNKPGIGGIELPAWAPKSFVPGSGNWTGGQGCKVPSWIAFDKQVLTFNAYYKEPIPESPLESYRVHICKIFYYMEDDTIQVVEPRIPDSGVPQGQIVRRHRIPLPPPCTAPNQFYTLDHFNVGCEIEIYSKVFFIFGCDDFTRNFLNRSGVSVPANLEPPCDIATENRKNMRMNQTPKKPHVGVDTRGKFLLHDRHVLRFWAYWDDRCNEFGDLRQFVVRYFLSDDTIEIREIIRPNSGYESFPLFLRRSRLPKTINRLVTLPGEKAPLTILNVLGSIHGTKNKKAHYMVDHLAPDFNGTDYYSDKDLSIGATINSFGRCFILTDCDEFTKHYYREKYNIEDFTPLVLDEPECEVPKPEIPPYNGWGTEEDSLQSWKSLEPKPPVTDIRRIIEKEKDILRFQAKLHKPNHRVNDDRIFTIVYYMADNTVQVFEQEHPNAGFPKGSFIRRTKIKKEISPSEFGKLPVYFDHSDFFAGNIITLNGFRFHLLAADEFTLCYMEANSDQFPVSNLQACIRKANEALGPLVIEDVLASFSENDTNLQGVMDFRHFRSLLIELAKCSLSEHEIMTLARAFNVRSPEPGTDFQTLQAVAQTELRRFNFDRQLLERIEYTLRHHDPCRTGTIDRNTLRSTLKGAKIPLVKELVDYMVNKWPAADGDNENSKCSRVDYCCFLKFLDWERNPSPIAKPAPTCCVMKWVEPKPPIKIFCVNYRAFLEQAVPNFKSALPSVCNRCAKFDCFCVESTNDQNVNQNGNEKGGQGQGQGQGDGPQVLGQQKSEEKVESKDSGRKNINDVENSGGAGDSAGQSQSQEVRDENSGKFFEIDQNQKNNNQTIGNGNGN